MPTYQFANFAASVLAQALTVNQNSFFIVSSDADKFPVISGDQVFQVTLHDGDQDPEIVSVTSNPLSGEMTCLRGQEGTSAKDWPIGTQVRHGATATALSGIVVAAASSAAAAAVSQTSAASSAASADAAKIAAQAAAASAASSLDSFDDRYLGAKSIEPNVDNDGAALTQGALYWNTASQKMRVYGGAGWADVVTGTRDVEVFSGDGTTTVFTLSADPGSDEAIDVYVAGLSLSPAQYSVAGTALTFAVAPTNGTGNIVVKYAIPLESPGTSSWSGGTVSGNIIVDKTADTSSIRLNADAAEFKQVEFSSDDDLRWVFGVDDVAEGGSNVGSNLFLDAYNDAGALIKRVLSVVRATGAAIWNAAFTVKGLLTVTDDTHKTEIGNGTIELVRTDGNAAIDFKNADGDDYDARIIQDGTSLNVVAAGGLKVNGSLLGASSAKVLHVQDRKTAGTPGGSATWPTTVGIYLRRTLNFVVQNTIAGASADTVNSQVTLPAGTYRVFGRVPAVGVNGHKAVLYNNTGGIALLRGCTAYINNAQGSSDSVFFGVFTLSVTSVLVVTQKGQNNNASTNALGYPVGFDVEVYTDVMFERLD